MTVGIKQRKDGTWEYRISFQKDGKKIDVKRRTDQQGNKLLRKKDAIESREEELRKINNGQTREKVITRKTYSEVYSEYIQKGRLSKADSTKRKQDSLWNIHLKRDFGDRMIDEVSVAEIEDYLASLYYQRGYSYQYVESFLKMFYLILGQANARNYLSDEDYNKYCSNKVSKIKMPKRKGEDQTDVVCFSKEQIAALDEYFKGTNFETPYLLGKYCGLRINECFGLKWENINFEEGQIVIDRQMQYFDGVIRLIPPKTSNGKRTIVMSDVLKEHLMKRDKERKANEIKYAEARMQKQRFIYDLDGKLISTNELVNVLADGTVQTISSVKYHSRKIKEKCGFVFHFHFLRHTFGTRLAEMNTPIHLLCDQLGHSSIEVTKKYYLSLSKSGMEIIRNNVNTL